MNGTRPPLTSTNASARAAVKRAKAGSAFTLDNSDFSLHLLVWFYIAARNLGTTAPKISVFSSVLKGKKFSILKAFHGATAFCGANANTISYNITFVNFKSKSLSSFSPFQAILRKETNIVQKGELQEEVIAKIQQARPAERWGERPKQGRHAFTTRIRHCGPPTARDFYTPWYKTVLRAFTPSQGTAGQRSFVPVRTAARPMDPDRLETQCWMGVR